MVSSDNKVNIEWWGLLCRWSSVPLYILCTRLVCELKKACITLYILYDQHRFLWTAIRGFISEFGLFPWRVLSAQPSPFQALIKITKTAENSGARK